jgi:ABC-type glycerol-3-phosphate transport system substrate-binding protein
MKKVKFLAVLSAAIIACTPLAACGGNEGSGDATTISFYCEATSIQKKLAYQNMVKNYNQGQGKTDGVYVRANYNASSAMLGTTLTGDSADVVSVDDEDFKAYAMLEYFLDLTPYMTETAKTAMQWDDIPDYYKDRWCYTYQVDQTLNKRTAGKGTTVLALPNGSTPETLFYNADILKSAGIHIISVSEAELDAYNTQNGTSYQPHGYAEYKVAPATGLTASTNGAGQSVYKVFNNRISMNWEEFRYLCRYLIDNTSANYGYVSQQWFDYGWSVGGDCIGWNNEKGEYEFTLDDKTANYLVLQDNVTVGGNTYNKGDIIRYEDKSFVDSTLIGDDKTFHELPSTYDAFLEFTRASVPTNKEADEGKAGYGIAYVNNTGGDTLYKNGSAVFYQGYSPLNQQELADAGMRNKMDIALLTQWREYVGGSLTDDGKLKVIGETYSGSVYTGELAKANGVDLVGKYSTVSKNSGIAIAKNAKSENREAAFKFVSWLVGPNGQKLLTDANTTVPNQTSIAFSSDYLDGSSRVVKNTWAASFSAQTSDLGDWSYFENGSWITDWANDLNYNTRFGTKTLQQFFDARANNADTALANMNLRVYR